MPITGFRRKRQQGVALIVTLVILVIITMVGLVAMRSGLLQVAMATNSQVDALLFQAADAGVGAIEANINANPLTANASTGILGIAKDNPGVEIPVCLKTSGLVTGTTVAGSYCGTSDYMSGRGAVRVQMAIRTLTSASGGLSQLAQAGTEAGLLPGDGLVQYELYSTSVMPAFGSATDTQVNTCLTTKKQYDPDTTHQNVTDCLAASNASYQTVVQEFAFGYAGYK